MNDLSAIEELRKHYSEDIIPASSVKAIFELAATLKSQGEEIKELENFIHNVALDVSVICCRIDKANIPRLSEIAEREMNKKHQPQPASLLKERDDDDDMLIDEDEDDQPQPAEEESDFDTEEGWEKAIQPESATKKPKETFIGGVPIAKTTIYSAGIRIGRSELNMTHTKELAEWLNKYLAAHAAYQAEKGEK